MITPHAHAREFPAFSFRRSGWHVNSFYCDYRDTKGSFYAVTDDFGDMVKTPAVYGEVDVDVDDDALELIWPTRALPEDHPYRVARERPVAETERAPRPPALDWLSYQRLKRKLDAWELDHLRELAAAQDQQLADQAARIADLERQLSYAQDTLDDQWRGTLELAERWEAEGTGYLGLSRDGSLCAIACQQVVDDFGTVVYLGRPQ